MRKLGLIVSFLLLLVGRGWAACPASITGTISPTSCWNINAGSGTTIADSSGSNTGTLSGTGYTWESNNNLLCSNSGGSGCNISTAATYSNAQPLTVVFSFAGTQGPIWQLGSTSSNTASTQFYLAYLDRLGRLTFGVNNYGNMSVLQSSLSYADGNQHIAVASIGPSSPTFSGGMRLYIDGQLVSSRNVQLANYSTGAQWFIGGANATIWPDGPSASFFNGTIYYLAWLNGTQVTDAQAQAMTGQSVSPISGVPLATLTATIGSISDVTGFAPPPGTAVYFSISGVQRPGTGDFIVAPTPSNKACQINAAGNLIGPTGLYANCQLPQGAHVTMTIGSTGQPLSLIIPFQSSVDLATLILAQTDPASLITSIATAGPLLVGTTVTNPATGQAGTATITAPNCSKVSTSAGAYALDATTATCQILTLGGSSTITPTGLIDSQLDTVYIVQDGTGGRVPTFAAPGGDTLLWVNGAGATQPAMPTTAANSITKYTFILNGTQIIASMSYQNLFNTMLWRGTTSGTQTWSVPAAAGTFSYALPGAQGGVSTQLQNDGAGNLSWAGANNSGTSLSFGGSMTFVSATNPNGLAPANIMRATRTLTVDNCYGAWVTMGPGCSSYPVLSVLDITAITTICSAVSDNTGSTGTSELVQTASIPSGDIVVVQFNGGNLTGCTTTPNNLAVGITYH